MRGRIAWSKSGFIAYIDSAHAVRVTWLRCVDGQRWEYAPPLHIPVPSEARPVMLSWSSSNVDLAIADELGRVQIVTVNASSAPISQIVASGVRDQRQRPVELDRVVAMRWLDNQKKMVVPNSQAEADASAAKAWNSVKPLGPFHPDKGRGALVCVNGNGMLRLLVQTPDNRYVEVDALIPGAQCVSHAVMASHSPESLLIALVGKAGTMQVYEAILRWRPSNIESKQDFVDIEVHPIAVAQLTGMLASDLRTLGVYRAGEDPNVTICAVSDFAIARYRLSLESESLHSSFFELFNKSAPVQPDPHKVWVLSDPVLEEKSTKIQWFLTTELLVFIIFEDGSVETESPLAQVPTFRLDTLQVKFAPADLVNTTDIDISPTNTSAAVFKVSSEDQPSLIRVGLSGSVDQEQMRKIAQSLAMIYSLTVINLEQCDDMVDVCRNLLVDSQIQSHASLFFETLTTEVMRLLAVALYVPEDRVLDKFLSVPSPLQQWLALLITLGTSAGWHRTPGSRLALCLLNLQLLDVGLAWTLRRVNRRARPTTAEHLRLEIAASQYHIAVMLGPIRWATDLIARICQELYHAVTAPEPPSTATYRENAAAYVLIEQPNVYNSLLFSTVGRCLLRFFLRGVQTLSIAAKGFAEQEIKLNSKLKSAMQSSEGALEENRARLNSPLNFVAAQTLKNVVTQLTAVPVKFHEFERLLNTVDEKIKALVAEANVPDQARQAMDAELIKLAKSPSFFMPLVNPLIATVRSVLLPSLNVPELYFYDTSWLGLDEEPSSLAIDSVRKRIILPNELVQQCCRCGMLSVATPEQAKPQFSQWFMVFRKNCLCGGSFTRISAESPTGTPRPGSEANRV